MAEWIAPFCTLAGTLMGSCLTYFLNKNTKIRELVWDRRQEAYSVLVVSIEECAYNARSAKVHEEQKTDKEIEYGRLFFQSYADHHDLYSKRRFIVSKEFASRHREMVDSLKDFQERDYYASMGMIFSAASNDLAAIAERELRP